MDFGAIWETIKNYFAENYMSYVRFFAVLIIGIIVIKILLKIMSGVFRRMEPVAKRFLLAIFKFVFWLTLILVLLSVVGVEITGMLTAVSAVLLAIGMALESNIANLANGIVIVSSHMLKKGDFITVGDTSGCVTEINFLFTTLTTLDNKRVTIPNSTIVNSAVVNAGANPKRRVDITFSVAYESDVELVKRTVIGVMRSNGKVYLDPEPFCKLKTIGESSLDFFSNCWCDSEDYWDVYYYLMENVYNEFKKNGIVIPYRQVEVREKRGAETLPFDNSPLPERKEKARKKEGGDNFMEKVKKKVDSKKAQKEQKKNAAKKDK
ncbi:MAG: mechanosensitive ion channel family protein [Clostridia bacterium]|nr:mechanosensitive ion channel family protein [Clostridia bacterium]